MGFTITAEFPLGTYRGAGADGQVEALPSANRLYSALLCAAGFGPRARPDGDRLALDPRDAQALRWLEGNPPDAVRVPALHVNRGRSLAYRDDGTLKKSKATTTTKKLGKHADASVAVAGSFAWTWSRRPPEPVVASLTALCADVPYLGTSESPVRLATATADGDDASSAATHVLDPDAGLFGPPGQDLEVPVAGRLDELAAAHTRATGKPPSVARDRFRTDESSTSAVPTREAVAVARYVAKHAPLADAPWPLALVVPVDRRFAEQERVRWAVAVHRALIRVIGDGAPPLITGVYPDGLRRPANRLAVHWLDAAMPVDLPGGADAAIALLIPQGCDPSDLGVLVSALGSLGQVRGPGGALLRVCGAASTVAGDQLWRPVPAGTIRLWRTSPPAVPDVRGLPGAGWTFAHTALLSLGFVVKDRLGPLAGRREAYYGAVIDAVNATGAAVVEASPLRTTSVQDYVHRVHDHAVVRPYRACLWLGDLAGDRSVIAIGQSRHLGGGLLVPLDLPDGSTLGRSV